MITTNVALIPIFDSTINLEIIKTVDAKELHKFLGVGKDFSSWMKNRIEQYDFVENQDFITCTPNLGSVTFGGHNRIDYHISIDMAKELSMVERNAKGKEARLYFIKCEKELINRFDPSKMSRMELIDFTIEAFQKAKKQEEEIQFLKQQNEHKSKMLEKYRVEFDEGLVYVTQVSNEFGIGPVKFSDFLKKLNIVSDTEKTVYDEFTHLFKYTEKYNSAKNDFVKILKVNMDGVVLLIELITNGIETISKSTGVSWTSADFDKLARKEIPDFVDTNILIFEGILSRYRKSNIGQNIAVI